jgi:hypothetical protein
MQSAFSLIFYQVHIKKHPIPLTPITGLSDKQCYTLKYLVTIFTNLHPPSPKGRGPG